MSTGNHKKITINQSEQVSNTSLSIPQWALPAVLLFTILIYSHALQNGLISCDDNEYITKNPFLRDFSWVGIKAIFSTFYDCNYHPLTMLTFLIEYTLAGLNPMPYHAFSIFVHVLNTWLVFKLVEQLSGKEVTALVVCILFAVHPMHVESVVWASETKDMLFGLFYLSSLLVYTRYISSGFKTGLYIFSALLFLLALLSKSAAVTLPVLLIAVDLYRNRKASFKLIFEKIPFFLLSLLFGILNLIAQQGAMGDMSSTYNIVSRLFLFSGSLAFYLVKLVAPFQLSLYHFFPGTDHGLLPWLFYASVPFLLLVLWLITRKNAYRREITFGVSYFLITISIMLQLIPVGSAFASERYTYIPYIGMFYILGQWIADTGINKYRNIVTGVFGLIVVVFTIQTWQRIGIWKDDDTLFGDIIKKDTPHAYSMSLALFEEGKKKKENGDMQGALQDFSGSILFCPKYENAWFNRALIYYSLGDFRPAIADYTKVAALDPKMAMIYNYRGWAYFQAGINDSAILDYNMAILLDSTNAEAYNNRGWIAYGRGNKQLAMKDYNKALLINPKFSGAFNNRGWAYYESGDTQSAISDYYKAISYDNHNSLAYSNLAAIKVNAGDLEGAIADYDSLIKLNPNDNSVYNTLGYVRLNQKDTSGACTDWKKAAELGNINAAQMVKQFCK